MIAAWLCLAVSDPTVDLNNGQTVVGTQLDGAEEFLGLRFAQPTKRFEPPVDYIPPAPGHDGVQETKHFRSACMQIGTDPNITYGSEDCLFANVWKPANAKKGDRLPVLCFVFGGSWQFGEPEPYNGSALAAKHGVIYASLAYRTGPIGLLPFHEDQERNVSTGNWAVQDVQSGLRWFQREIENFGGDPDRVTIHGQSSGGQAVELHYVSPHSKGLLSGIISESGGLGAQSLDAGLEATMKVAEATDCMVAVNGTKQASKACLQRVPAVKLTSMTSSLSLSPHIDGVTIPSDPLQMLSDGDINSEIALMMGAQTNDSNKELFVPFIKADGVSLRPLPSDAYLAALELLLPKSLEGELLLKKVLELYPAHNDHPSDPLLGGSVSNLRNLGSATTDSMLCGARRRLSMINKHNPGRAFMYRFNYWYQSNANCTPDPNYHSSAFGAQHEDEVTFVMGQPIFMQDGSCCGVFGDHTSAPNVSSCPELPSCASCYAPGLFDPDHKGGYTPYFNRSEAAFADAVGRFWTNFASSQNPNVQAEVEDGAGGGHTSSDSVWPSNPSGGALRQNLVLDATIGAPHYAAAEDTIHGRPEICDLWDRIDAAHKQAHEAGSVEHLARSAPMDGQSRSMLIAKMVAIAGARP